LTLAALPALAWAATAAAPAPISAVTLYPGSATITRTAQVAAGSTRLLVAGLAGNFEPRTLRVEADPGIRVAEVEIQDLARTESANPAEADLEARIQALQDEAATLDAEAGAADVVKAYLDRLGAPAESAPARAAPDAKSLGATLEVIGRAAGDALARKQRLAVQKREIEKKIAALQRDLQRLRGEAHDSRSISVHLAAERGGNVRLSYQILSAGWKPAYRAELDSARSLVTLARLAQVAQKSGEDWKDVKMVLSTSQPRLSPLAPEPEPWLISYEPPRIESKKESLAMDLRSAPAPAPMVRAQAALAGKPAATGGEAPYLPPTFETSSAFATEFEVPGPVTLPADGRQVALELGAQSLAVRQRIQVTPRIDKAATVTAEAERPDGVWLPGDLQVYRDGNYVGAGNWNPQAADKLALSFGRDELLRVSVDALKSDSGNTGLFEKRRQRRIADVITLKSTHTTPIDVLLLEPGPVSTADEVTVQATFDPPPNQAAWKEKRGVVAWERSLKPGESARFSVNYLIEFPRDGSVTGLR
jgi:uncharacterized protein (TIGR02231 family)